MDSNIVFTIPWGHDTNEIHEKLHLNLYFQTVYLTGKLTVAEMGAAFLCGFSSIEQKIIRTSAAYIQGWLKVLKNDRSLLIHAAVQAQKASDYILNVQSHEQEE